MVNPLWTCHHPQLAARARAKFGRPPATPRLFIRGCGHALRPVTWPARVGSAQRKPCPDSLRRWRQLTSQWACLNMVNRNLSSEFSMERSPRTFVCFIEFTLWIEEPRTSWIETFLTILISRELLELFNTWHVFFTGCNSFCMF